MRVYYVYGLGRNILSTDRFCLIVLEGKVVHDSLTGVWES